MTARFADHILPAGLLAARPAATAVPAGALYPATDSGIIYQSDGTAWSTWRPAAEALPVGGATGQVLTKQSATDGDADWETPSSGGGGAVKGIDDPTQWSANLGYDLEFETDGTSLPSGWSWVNQGTSTWEQKFGAGLLKPQTGSGGDTGQRMLVRALPTESTWEATLKCSGFPPSSGMGHIGMVLRDSSTGKYTVLGVRNEDSVAVVNWSATEVYGGSVTGNSFKFCKDAYLRIRKLAGGNYDWEWSYDGFMWRAILSNAGPYASFNQIGFMAHAPSGSYPSKFPFHWFRVR